VIFVITVFALPALAIRQSVDTFPEGEGEVRLSKSYIKKEALDIGGIKSSSFLAQAFRSDQGFFAFELIFVLTIAAVTALWFYLLFKAAYKIERQKEKQGLFSVSVSILKEGVSHFLLTCQYLLKKPSLAFLETYRVDQQGTWRNSFVIFRRNRVLITVIVGVTLAIIFAQFSAIILESSRADEDTGNTIYPGEVLEFTIEYENQGTMAFTNISLSDYIDTSFDYVEGSLKLNGTQKTDRDGDDEVSLINNAIIVRLSRLEMGQRGTLTFVARVKEDMAKDVAISNFVTANSSSGELIASSNTVVFNGIVLGEISGTVFNDSNRSQTINQNEAGISEVLLKLYRDNNKDQEFDGRDSYLSVAVSGINGSYSFTNLSSGHYLVIISPEDYPEGYELSSSNNLSPILLPTSLEKKTDVDFGFYTERVAAVELEEEPVALPEQNLTGPTITPSKAVYKKRGPDVLLDALRDAARLISSSDYYSRVINPFFSNIQKYYRGLRTNSAVQNVNQFIFLPLSTASTIAGLLMALPIATTALPLLQYFVQQGLQMFFFPVSIFSRRKIKRWGIVYSALSKEPLDLVIVRLIDAKTDKILETKVTGSEGRYFFLTESDIEVRIEARKDNFIFPSTLVTAKKHDGDYENLYFGETFVTQSEAKEKRKKDTVVALDIPLDLKEGVYMPGNSNTRVERTLVADLNSYSVQSQENMGVDNKKIIYGRFFRAVSNALTFVGPIGSLLAYVISPSSFSFLVFIANVLSWALFWRLSLLGRKNAYGSVFDKGSRKKLSRAVVRLFEPTHGRLVAADVTDRRGRYGFLAQKKEYLLTSDKEGYQLPGKWQKISAKEKLVDTDIGMEAQGKED